MKYYFLKIACVIEEVLDVDVFSMKNKNRKNADAFAIFCWFVSKQTNMTRMSIGKRTNRDHSSVTAAIKRFNTLYISDSSFTKKVLMVALSLDSD